MPGVLELQQGASALRRHVDSAAQGDGVPKGGKAHAGVLSLEQLRAATATLRPTQHSAQQSARPQSDAEPSGSGSASPSHAARVEVAKARGRLRKAPTDTAAAKAPAPALPTNKENRSPRLAVLGCNLMHQRLQPDV